MSDELFEEGLKPISNKTRDLAKARVQSLHRDMNKVPQVIVKVSSYGRSVSKVRDNLRYISRDDDMVLEDPMGNQITSSEEMEEIIQRWGSDETAINYQHNDKRKGTRLTANIILSAPKGSDRPAVARAVRQFARDEFADNQDYLFAMHNNTDSPHAHIAVKLRGYDGQKLRIGKKELHHYRVYFAEKLREQGISATASYQSERGIARKRPKQSIYQMRARDVVPEVDAAAKRDVVAIAKGQGRARPWIKPIKARNKKIKQEIKTLGLALTASPDAKDLGQTLIQYAQQLPNAMTRDELLMKQLVASKEDERSR